MSNLPIMSPEAQVEAIKAVDKHVGETYDNLINVPSKGIGEILNIIYKGMLAKAEFKGYAKSQYYAAAQEKFKQKLQENIDKIPFNKFVMPDINTILQIVDSAECCITDDNLRNMFTKLIASAINSDTVNSVHPAFATILKQMNYMDAKLVISFKINPMQPISNIIYHNNNNSYKTIYSSLFLINGVISDKQNLVELGISNLTRLGIIEVDYNSALSDDKNYADIQAASKSIIDGILSSEEYKDLGVTDPTKTDLKNGIVQLTELGHNFILVCC